MSAGTRKAIAADSSRKARTVRLPAFAPTTFTTAVTPEAKTANPAKTSPNGSAAKKPPPCNTPTIDPANKGCTNDTRDDNTVPTKTRTNAPGSNRKTLTKRRKPPLGGSARNTPTKPVLRPWSRGSSAGVRTRGGPGRGRGTSGRTCRQGSGNARLGITSPSDEPTRDKSNRLAKPEATITSPPPHSSHHNQPNSPHGDACRALQQPSPFPLSRKPHPSYYAHQSLLEQDSPPRRFCTNHTDGSQPLPTHSNKNKTPTQHKKQSVLQQFLQRHTIQQSTRAALNEPETGWLANGDTHRQPPATYGKPEHRLQHTTSERTKRHDHPAPSTRPLTSTGDDLPHHHSQ